MKKLLFDFIDFDSDKIDSYELLGFILEVDDELNQVLSVELDLSNYDLLALFSVMEDCDREGLSPNLELNDEIYDFDKGIKIVDELTAVDPLKI